jgi:hypothetical protein
MDRTMNWTVYGYFGLAVAHWGSVARLLHGPHAGLWCGNVVTDPYLLLMNKLTPIVAVCVVLLLARRIQAHRRPFLPLLVLPVFLGTTAGLLYEAYWLLDYSFPIHDNVWWFPWI